MRKNIIRIFLCMTGFIFLLSSQSSFAKPITFDVTGLKNELQDNVNYYLSSLPAIDEERYPFQERKVRQTVRNALQAVGYYSPKIQIHVDEKQSDKIIIRIDPGEPVHVRTISVELYGDAENDPAFNKLLATLDLKVKDIFHHGKYENIKSRIKTLAATNGYFDAVMKTSTVKVYPKEKVADIYIDFESGYRYKFGQISVTGIDDQKVIQPLISFKKNEEYNTRRLAELSKSLSQTRYFQVVDVHADMKSVSDYHVPIIVDLKKKKPNQMETGLGFSTDEGPRVQWNWERPWVNDAGHRFTSQIKVAQKTQTADFNYIIPNKNPIDDYYKIQTTFENQNQSDTQYQLAETGIHYWTRLIGDWQRDYFFKTSYEMYNQGEDTGNSLLFMPGASITRLRSRGGIDPYWGDQQSISVMFSDPLWFSDTRFVKVWGRSKWLRTYADNHRFIFRAEQGALLWGNLSEIPASQRFFTGGDQTVRGFAYKSISPVDSSGELSGALNTTSGSIEYNYQVAPKWRLALFVDAGTATNDYKDPWKVGTGIGGRWLTPVGPLRVDLAFGVSEQSVPFRLHFALGPEL